MAPATVKPYDNPRGRGLAVDKYVQPLEPPTVSVELSAELLKNILGKLDEQAAEIRALRETVIRLETHGYHEQIKNIREENQTLRDKIIILETQGRTFTAGVSAAVSVCISVISALIVWSLKTPN